jgi:methylenetetrahydrofolate dehydrogenase (NADP+)/methenyltetrahydrofolate cyclohydrolase
LNNNPEVHGILVQLPLPKHLNEEKILLAIDPKKDVDSFHPYNVGKLMIGNYDFAPCTPAGIMEMLKREKIEVEGKECVVIGRSNIVGKPIAQFLMQANGTVTMCHSKTRNLSEVCRRADILVCAVGKPKFVTGDYIKPGAVILDVGINRLDGKLCGDVDYEVAKDIASYITPVPGGCGPMTIAMLLRNTLKAAKLQTK